MNLISIKKAAAIYKTEPMKGNIARLKDFDAFHWLVAGSLSISLKLKEKYQYLPVCYLDWLKICDGGLLFDTVLLSSEGHDDSLDFDFDTYEEMNSEKAYREFNLPDNFFVFAIRNYGDPVCFYKNDKEGKVYLWNVEDGEFSDIWDSFADWLTEEIDDAIRLIAEGVLSPLEIKINGEIYE